MMVAGKIMVVPLCFPYKNGIELILNMIILTIHGSGNLMKRFKIAAA